uniref:Ig-like domain-containing protein n=1 Tax=Kryptolebias marmoratus TaxID=37003 RepID=A0A3Q3BKQ4_KRYMA
MLNSLFVCGVLGVLLVPARSQSVTVCVEDDRDLRVDCLIKPKPNKISSYEFSWSSGTKETLINTNVSGSVAEAQFKDKSAVVELEPHGYRMTLRDFADKVQRNTIFMCKISGQVKSLTVENRDQLQTCSAVSMFLKTSWFWMACLLSLYYTHS